MKSPFVGMDPYIESNGLWRNFHGNLLIKIQDTLADLVPPHYLVRAEERSYLILSAFIESEVRETYIEVFVTEPEHRLITTIEVLSPSNKERGGHGWELYLRKRQAALVCGVHLVEIDLLRGGTRLPMRDPWPKSPYTLLVAPQAAIHLRRLAGLLPLAAAGHSDSAGRTGCGCSACLATPHRFHLQQAALQ